jgi:hypothetical protein
VAANALSVSFAAPVDGTPFDIKQLGSAAYPNFGVFLGPSATNANFGPGSYNYAIFTAISHSEFDSVQFSPCCILILPPLSADPGSPATVGPNSFSSSSKIESAIWTFDPTTLKITPQWINEDGSRPATYPIYNSRSQIIEITGDVTSFTGSFGTVATIVSTSFFHDEDEF